MHLKLEIYVWCENMTYKYEVLIFIITTDLESSPKIEYIYKHYGKYSENKHSRQN